MSASTLYVDASIIGGLVLGDIAVEPVVASIAITLVGRASLPLKLPDAIHVAIGEWLNLPLLTGDRQQARAAERLGLPTSYLSMKDIR